MRRKVLTPPPCRDTVGVFYSHSRYTFRPSKGQTNELFLINYIDSVQIEYIIQALSKESQMDYLKFLYTLNSYEAKREGSRGERGLKKITAEVGLVDVCVSGGSNIEYTECVGR